MNPKPNLFIIGAMKSGTSSLHNYIASHPSIFMSSFKEPMHFSREENWSKGEEAYLRLFEQASTEKYVGESSTEYSKLPERDGVVERLYEFNPEARFVYIMRDPFERVVSQYKHMVKTKNTRKSLLEEIFEPSDYLTNSYYAYQLAPYIEKFGREAIFVGSFEDLVSDPVSFCQSLFRWLGIDENFIPENLQKLYHASPTKFEHSEESGILGNQFLKLRNIKMLRELTPRFIRVFLKQKFTDTVEFDFSSDEFKSEVDNARQLLYPIMSNWVDELQHLTGTEFNQWFKKVPPSSLPKADFTKIAQIEDMVEGLIGKALPKRYA